MSDKVQIENTMDRRDMVAVDMDVAERSEGNGSDVIEVPLDDFIRRLRAARDAVPREARATACFRVKTYGDYDWAFLSVRYVRPETDEELAARSARDARYEAEREARDRAEFERLARKYGR